MVALLTINSFPFPFPHQIIGGLNVLLNLIFFSLSDRFKMMEAILPLNNGSIMVHVLSRLC